MMPRISPPVALTALLVLALLMLWGQRTYYQGELARAAQAAAERQRDQARAAAEQLAAAHRDADALQQQLAGLDARYTRELTHAENDNRRLDAAVADRDQRLRILARRPEHCPAVPAAPDGAGVDTGTWVELSAAARRAYSDLRSGLTRNDIKLRACQDMLKTITAARAPAGG
jgi:prophage endopeptidase